MCGWIASLTGDVASGLRLLTHRGIRTTKVDLPWGASIGHVRLPIVGLGTEWDQPITDGHDTFAYVGEILDFRDYAPTDECDVMTVVRNWKQGPEAFRKHDGFWSICVVNSHHKTMHLLCDYLAQKPTYYRKDMAAAASELDALAALGRVAPDEVYFAAVIKWGYCPEQWRTPYQEIWRVLPGEHVVMTETGCSTRAVDALTSGHVNLRDEIELAIKRRVLSSDVPVACLVSGGLDSSIVYTLARKYGSVLPYFAEDQNDPDLSEQLRVSAVTSPVPVQKILWNLVSLERALRYMQEPVDLGSLVPQTALADQIRERVCLTGDGADECFGGYGRSMRYDSQASDIFHELVCWHLPRLDRIMMRNQIEVRSPFLARRVVQGAMALPWSMRKDKSYLRQMFRNDLPPGIADAPKKPLRTTSVEKDREAHTKMLVDMFRRTRWPSKITKRMEALLR